MPEDILYSIRNLTVEYNTRAGPVRAVDDVSLDIRRGEILGLVGESGCGKSTLGKALMRLHEGLASITAGELWFDGRDLMKLSLGEMPEIRGAEIGMVFQDPMTSLNPVQRILDHLTETIHTHEPKISMPPRAPGPKNWSSGWGSGRSASRNIRTRCPAACASGS